MGDFSTAINNYIAAAKVAREKLEAKYGVPITPLTVQELLAERQGVGPKY